MKPATTRDPVERAVTEFTDSIAPPAKIFYDAEKKEYLMKNAGGRWLSFNQAQVKRRLRSLGYSNKPGDSATSEVEEILQNSEEYHDIRYAAPLAGKVTGFYEENGLRYLVTDSPTLIEPKRGDFPTLQAVLNGLFVNGEDATTGPRQLFIFKSWLRHAIISLRAGKLSQAQAIAICGPANSGKSLIQKIITKLLGGRSAKGARYMTGKTEFNAELCAAEHIILEDEHMSNRMADRLRFGTQIKNVTVSTDTVSCHRKGHTAVNLPVWWRVSITLNDNPEDLRILPPLNESVKDKIIILRAHSCKMPMPTVTPDERSSFWETLNNELPAFVHNLINDLKIPKESSCPRYGIATWHHPDLALALYEISSEAHLLKLIDLALWKNEQSEWEGTAEGLRSVLIDDYQTSRDARQLMASVNGCGTLLGRLANSDQSQNRIISQRTNKTRGWKILKSPPHN